MKDGIRLVSNMGNGAEPLPFYNVPTLDPTQKIPLQTYPDSQSSTQVHVSFWARKNDEWRHSDFEFLSPPPPHERLAPADPRTPTGREESDTQHG